MLNQAAAEQFPSSLSKMAGGEVGVTLGQPHLSRQDLATLVSSRFAAGMRPELGRGHGLLEGVAMRHRPGGWSAG